MKTEVITCDLCGTEGARSFKYEVRKTTTANPYDSIYKYKDLCLNCMQDFVRSNNVKLEEVTSTSRKSSKKNILFG